MYDVKSTYNSIPRIDELMGLSSACSSGTDNEDDASLYVNESSPSFGVEMSASIDRINLANSLELEPCFIFCSSFHIFVTKAMSISGNLVMSKKSSVVLLELEFVGRSISVEIRASMMEW